MTRGVALGFSGGVDSTLAAVKLAEMGYQVHAVHLNMWKWGAEGEGETVFQQHAIELQQVAGVQLASIDASESMRKLVIEDFNQQLSLGNTPSPCIRCNPLVKFKLLLDYADTYDLQYIATGHYARVQLAEDGQYQLLRALDHSKDQSYMLCYLTQAILSRTLFPLGQSQKTEIKQTAHDLGLSVSEQPESQDLCFLNQHSYQEFVKHFSPDILVPGEIVNRKGEVLGRHEGLALYTIGQRKGIRIAAGEAYYVIEKDTVNNQLVVGFLNELGKKQMRVEKTNWISGSIPDEYECDVKIRYRAKIVPARLERIGKSNDYEVHFREELRDITPGQFAVFYRNDQVLGGGMISKVVSNNV
jgi:tRNA-specific 2-thiouridylase